MPATMTPIRTASIAIVGLEGDARSRLLSSVGDLCVDGSDLRTRAAHAGVEAIVFLIGGRDVSPVDHLDALEAGLAEPLHHLRRALAMSVARRESIAGGMQCALEGERLHAAVPSLAEPVVADVAQRN